MERVLQNSSADPLCRYKSLVLKASLISARDWSGALKLLSQEPPAALLHSDVAVRRLLAQGRSYANGDQFTESAALLDQAEKAADLYAPELKGTVFSSQGYLEDVQNHSEEAEKKYRAALQFALDHHQETLEGDSRVSLGRILAKRERYSEAIDQLQRALEIVHTNQKRESALGNLGWSHAQLGDTDQAILFLQKAETIAAEASEPFDQQDWFTQLGNTYLEKNNYADAENYYQKSLSLARELKDPALISSAFHNLAQLEIIRSNFDAAENYNRQSYTEKNLRPEDTSDPYLTLTTSELLRAHHQCSSAEKLLSGIVNDPKSDSSLKWKAHSDLASCYVDVKNTSAAQKEFEKGVAIVENATDTVKEEERRMSILDAWPFYDDYIKFLVDQNNPGKALQIAEFSRARTLADAFGLNGPKKTSSLQIPAVERLLQRSNRVILAYWLSDKGSYLWAVTPRHFRLFHLPSKAEIEALVQENKGQITSERLPVGESTAARNLYQILIQPAASMLPTGAHVVVVPNRGLYSLNFETLVTGGPDQHYWIKDVTIENASSISLLLNAGRIHRRTTKDLLVIGAPTEADPQFPTLKFASAELNTVAATFPPRLEKVNSGADATPLAYRKDKPENFRLIHFVTHGTANQLSPLDSAVILSRDSDKEYKLYARDIRDSAEKHPLNAELVTISACYSAGNKTYAGEGLVGLAWAFMRAGAHQVIASLWEVDDEATAGLMADLYSEIKHGHSPADALHEAKLRMIDSADLHHRAAYYWASLQLYTGP